LRTVNRVVDPASFSDPVTAVLRATLALSCSLVLASCGDPYAAVARHVRGPVDSTAREFLRALASRDTVRAEAAVHPAHRGPEAWAALAGLASALRGRAPDSVRALNASWFLSGDMRRTIVTYELAFPDHWVLAEVSVLDSAGNVGVIAARTNEVPRAAAAANALTLRGKPPRHFLLALAMLVVPLFIVVTAVQVWRSRMHRRWLWTVVALVGVGKLSMNWTTGALGFQPLYAQLLGAGIVRNGAPYMPWLVSVSVPVGALLAQLRLWRRRGRPNEAVTATEQARDSEALI
jgi:hypothetical protein